MRGSEKWEEGKRRKNRTEKKKTNFENLFSRLLFQLFNLHRTIKPPKIFKTTEKLRKRI
jgi:hypothetical protein